MFKAFEALTSGDTLELRMYGPIGGGMFGGGVSAEAVAEALDQAKDARRILLRLSSPGGAAFDGMAIRSMLSMHPAKVTCEVEGLAASAASIVAMGADVIKMHEGSAMMVHRSSTVTGGDVAEHTKAVNALTALDDGMATVYAARSGMSKDDCVHMMDAETWLTAEQAVEKKLADEVMPAKKSNGAPTAFDLSPFGYRHAPQQFTAAAKPAPLTETHNMSLARIATALGLADSAEEAAVIAALGKAQARTNAAESALNELRAVVSAETNEALLGSLRGLQSAAAQLPELKAKVEEQQKSIENQERAALFAADAVDPKGRKLTPALVKLFESKSPAEIKAFLDVAPHIVVVSAAVATTAQPTAAVIGGAAPDAITHNGKSWEQLTAAEKHNLHVDDIAAYKALRDNHIARGKPRAQAQQQRESA